MPFLKVTIKVTSESGDVVRPGHDTYAVFPIWCSSEEQAFKFALRRLNKEPDLCAVTDGQKPSDEFHLELVETTRIGFGEWLWGSFAPGVTLVPRDGSGRDKLA